MSIDPNSAPADELLQALTVGDVAPDDAAVAARFAREHALAVRWRELAATLGELRELRDVHADALGSGTAEPSHGARGRTDGLGAPGTFRRSGRGRWWLLAGGIAAALVASWLLFARAAPVADPTLGPGGVPGALAPEGEWPPGEPLRWPPVPHAAGYRIEVRPVAGATAHVLPDGRHGELIRGESWLPAPEQRAALPASFQWRVLAFDASDELLRPTAWATTHR